MKITFTKSFEKSLKKHPDKEAVKKAVKALITAIEDGVKPEGLGLKKLRDDIWEMRSGIRVRVLFSLLSREIRLLFVGSHDDIRSYLKNL